MGRTPVARRRLASLALTTTSSPAASSPILASALDAPSATTPWLTTASSIARQPACSAGASPDASRALSLPKTVLQDALASLLRLLTHAWMSWPKLFRMGLLSVFFRVLHLQVRCHLSLLGGVIDLPQQC